MAIYPVFSPRESVERVGAAMARPYRPSHKLNKECSGDAPRFFLLSLEDPSLHQNNQVKPRPRIRALVGRFSLRWGSPHARPARPSSAASRGIRFRTPSPAGTPRWRFLRPHTFCPPRQGAKPRLASVVPPGPKNVRWRRRCRRARRLPASCSST